MPPSHRSVLSRFSLQHINLPAVHVARIYMVMPCITAITTILMGIIRNQKDLLNILRGKIIILINENNQKFGSSKIIIWINP
jgi:hypothetical protein